MKVKFILFLMTVSILINLMSFKKGHNWGGDFAGYIIQAKTISEGTFDKLNNDIENNEFILNYPWGYPLLLSPIINLFDSHIIWLKIYTYTYFILALLFIYLVFREKKTNALFTILLLTSNPFFWELKNSLVSDFPNLFFTYLSLYFLKIVYIDKKIVFNKALSYVLLGILFFLTYLIRNQSFLLFGSLFVIQILESNKKKFIYETIPYFTFILLFLVVYLLNPIKSTNYLAQYSFNFLDILNTLKYNLFYYINVWNEFFTKISLITRFSYIFTGASLIMFIVGFIKVKGELIFRIFFVFNIFLFIVTPFYQGIRYLIPIVPIYIYFFVNGIEYFIEFLTVKYRRIITASLIFLISILSIKTILRLSYFNYKINEVEVGPYMASSKKMFSYLNKKTKTTDRIGFYKPRVMLLYSDRYSAIPHNINDFKYKNINYFVYYRNANYDQISVDSIYKYSDYFRAKFENKDFVVYKIKFRKK